MSKIGEWFKYKLENIHTGEIHYKTYSISQLEESGLKGLFDIENYNIIDRFSFTGLCDRLGNKIFDKDTVKANVFARRLGDRLGVEETEIECEWVVSIELHGIWLEGDTEENSGYMVNFDYDYDFEDNGTCDVLSFEIIR